MTTPTTITTSADSIATGISGLVSNANNQLINWADTSAPGTPSNGQHYIDNTTATRLVGKLRQNGAWVNMILTHILEEALDCDDNELQNFLVHKLATGSLPAASAGNEAKLAWDTTLERVAAIGSATQRYLAECALDGSTYIRIPSRLSVTGIGTPATTPSTSSILDSGYQLDAAAESLYAIAQFPIPTGYTNVVTAGKDLTLEVECYLLNAETAGDDINIGCTWEALTAGQAPGDDAITPSDVAQDIGSDNGQYDRHVVTVTVDYDAPAANVAAGDLMIATINHDPTIATPVAGVIVTNVWWKVPVVNFDS